MSSQPRDQPNLTSATNERDHEEFSHPNAVLDSPGLAIHTNRPRLAPVHTNLLHDSINVGLKSPTESMMNTGSAISEFAVNLL